MILVGGALKVGIEETPYLGVFLVEGRVYFVELKLNEGKISQLEIKIDACPGNQDERILRELILHTAGKVLAYITKEMVSIKTTQMFILTVPLERLIIYYRPENFMHSVRELILQATNFAVRVINVYQLVMKTENEEKEKI